MGGPRVPPFFFTWHDMIRKRLAGERGQGIIECAVIFPIFVLLVFVVVDGGILMGRYGGVNHAADTGARLAATADITRTQFARPGACWPVPADAARSPRRRQRSVCNGPTVQTVKTPVRWGRR